MDLRADELEARKTLMQLYFNSSLQATGFILVFILALVSLLTNHESVDNISSIGVNLLYFGVGAIVTLGFFESFRAVHWAEVGATIADLPGPALTPEDDVYRVVSRYYRNEARAAHKWVARVGGSGFRTMLAGAIIVGMVAGVLGPLTHLLN